MRLAADLGENCHYLIASLADIEALQASEELQRNADLMCRPVVVAEGRIIQANVYGASPTNDLEPGRRRRGFSSVCKTPAAIHPSLALAINDPKVELGANTEVSEDENSNPEGY
jgi:hypothetical protein